MVCPFSTAVLVFLAGGVASAADPAPIFGPYSASSKVIEFAGMDSSDQLIDVFFPSGPASVGLTFPLLCYAHGDSSSTPADHYPDLFEALVSWGYIVVAPRACPTGCHDDRTSLPLDPSGFAHYYEQQLKAIAWAKNQSALPGGDPALVTLDVSRGVAIAGHSMGGQATLFSAADADALATHDIRVAVMHHAFTHTNPPPLVRAARDQPLRY